MKKFTKILLTLCLTFGIFSFTNAELSNDKKIILDQRVNKIISNYDLQKLGALNSALKKFDTSKYSGETLETIKYVISKFENEYNKKVKEIGFSNASNEIKNQAKKFLEYSQESEYIEDELLQNAKLAFYKNPEGVEEVKRLLKSGKIKFKYFDIENHILKFFINNNPSSQRYRDGYFVDFEHFKHFFIKQLTNDLMSEKVKNLYLEKFHKLYNDGKLNIIKFKNNIEIEEEIQKIFDLYHKGYKSKYNYTIEDFIENYEKNYGKNSKIIKELRRKIENGESKIIFGGKKYIQERFKDPYEEFYTEQGYKNIREREYALRLQSIITNTEVEKYAGSTDKEILNIYKEAFDNKIAGNYQYRLLIRYLVTYSTLDDNGNELYIGPYKNEKTESGRVILREGFKEMAEKMKKERQKK